MNPLELKTLICDQCGKELRPRQDTLRGAAKVTEGKVLYLHPANRECPHSEEVYEAQLFPANLPYGHTVGKTVGKMDWRELPAKLVEESNQ